MSKLKKFLPNSLYGRFLLIIVIPALIVQVVSIYVFYYTHIDVVSKHMGRSVVAEMDFIKKTVNNPKYERLLVNFSQEIGLKFSFEERRRLRKRSKIADSEWQKSRFYDYINPLIDPYNRFKSELKSHKLTPFEIYKNPENDYSIIVKVQSRQGLISFDVPIKRITSSSSYVFTFWMLLTAFITSIISIIFLRNQVRSIHNLSLVDEKLGRNQDVKTIKPSGSREIRSLAIAFIRMKERINRQISQKTQMLSAVSHDLRTPLTRMKLQLAMMKNGEEIEDLKSDINDMEKLIDEYLSFARGDEKERKQPVEIKNFLRNELINYYQKISPNLEYLDELPTDLIVSIKKMSLRRALVNLIDNALKYGNKALVSVSISDKDLVINIEDDGPGIPKEEIRNVFKPFYRIDNSRNLDKEANLKSVTSGSGLGLAIVMDTVNSHGGNIRLFNSSLGGLLVKIFIPIE